MAVMSMTKMTRRGTHVMFSVFAKGVKKHGRMDAVYDNDKRRRRIVAWMPSKETEQLDFVGVEVDAHWMDEMLVITKVEAWKSHDYKLTTAKIEEVMVFVQDSPHWARVVKTLQKEQ